MSNNDFDRIISLVSIAGEIDGRTKFQKMVYILKCKGAGFSERFKYHYYGPYSLDLQLEIEELVHNEQLTCTEQTSSTYRYCVKSDSHERGVLARFEKLIGELNKTNYRILELVGTIFFLREEEGVTDKHIIREKLKFLKPHLEQHIEDAFMLEDRINSMAA
jgi:uncharacterized protein YwgA